MQENKPVLELKNTEEKMYQKKKLKKKNSQCTLIIVVACTDSFIADLTEECRKKDLEKTFMRQVNISTFFGLTLKMKLNLSISKI